MTLQDKEDIKQYLLNTMENAVPASGGTQVICTCNLPGCDDTKQHLYIGPFDDSDSPIMYNCWKCQQHGIVNAAFMAQYGIHESSNILNRNKSGGMYSGRAIAYGNNAYHFHSTMVTDCELSRNKLQYINERLGFSFGYQECLSNKIILNLFDFMTENMITVQTRNMKELKQLNDCFIGFLSRSNGSLNMRNLMPGQVLPSIDKKYLNYNVTKKKFDNDYYILPTSFDITQRVKIYVAEGPFDILSIKYNVMKDFENALYIAGKGKAYESAIKNEILNHSVMFADVHYFVDNDVPDNFIHRFINNSFRPFTGFRFYIHRNGYPNEKDFGVPAYRIVDNCVEYRG